jgi:hypothetical protein
MSGTDPQVSFELLGGILDKIVWTAVRNVRKYRKITDVYIIP